MADDERLLVRLEKTGAVLQLRPDQVTNYSLAARKAWVTGPNRAVGRRKGTKFRDRVTVTLRIDREVWEQFSRLEASGVIVDRNAVASSWFREKLEELGNRKRRR